jgi:hypothetical protein
MRKILSLVLFALSATTVIAQDDGVVQRSSSPRGVEIHGDTHVNAGAQNVQAVSAGDANAARNTTGTVRGKVQIQGNTRINANAQNVNSIAVGNKNTADNNVGGIGGK